jgi:hypothetical protein
MQTKRSRCGVTLLFYDSPTELTGLERFVWHPEPIIPLNYH